RARIAASGVGMSRPLSRAKRVSARSLSSWARIRLTPDWLSPMALAVAIVEPVERSVRNTSSCLMFMVPIPLGKDRSRPAADALQKETSCSWQRMFVAADQAIGHRQHRLQRDKT